MNSRMNTPTYLFTDGACSGNPGPGGWGAVLILPEGEIQELGGSSPSTTNNQMELSAALYSLIHLSERGNKRTGEIHLSTDSSYVIRGATQWIHSWKKRDWQTAQGTPVQNIELWMRLDSVMMGMQIHWHHVAGHASHPLNERCDEIAVSLSKGKTPSLFYGPKSQYPVIFMQDDLIPKRSLSKKGPKYYISLIRGELKHHQTWDECLAHVSGKPFAKYKKVSSQEEEDLILRSWGYTPSSL